jgi:hypothetical protein
MNTRMNKYVRLFEDYDRTWPCVQLLAEEWMTGNGDDDRMHLAYYVYETMAEAEQMKRALDEQGLKIYLDSDEASILREEYERIRHTLTDSEKSKMEQEITAAAKRAMEEDSKGCDSYINCRGWNVYLEGIREEELLEVLNEEIEDGMDLIAIERRFPVGLDLDWVPKDIRGKLRRSSKTRRLFGV